MDGRSLELRKSKIYVMFGFDSPKEVRDNFSREAISLRILHLEMEYLITLFWDIRISDIPERFAIKTNYFRVPVEDEEDIVLFSFHVEDGSKASQPLPLVKG